MLKNNDFFHVERFLIGVKLRRRTFFIMNTYPKIEAVVDSPLSKLIFTGGGHAPVRPPPLLCNGQKINSYHIIKKELSVASIPCVFIHGI